MKEEKEIASAPTHAYITLVVAFIIVGVGYYMWLTYHPEKIDESGLQAAVKNTESTTLTPSTESLTPTEPIKNLMHTITIETNKGTIVFETYDADAPLAAKNFVDLAKKSFYDGIIFHRVIKGFMIQGGDPTGTGRGGPGYTFADELNASTESYKTGYKKGVVAMANAGPNTNGSQFFIMHADYPLQHNYTIFGRVVSGLDVVDAIANVKVGEADKPLEDIVMKKVTVVEK